jgi:hypothetical protein
MKRTETNLALIVEEIVSHGELAETYHQRSERYLKQSEDYQQLAIKERLACQSQYDAFMGAYAQDLCGFGSGWAKSGIPKELPPQIVLLLFKILRELWAMRKDRKLPETMEMTMEGLLLVAIKSLQKELAK